jgi:hypothetical protein
MPLIAGAVITASCALQAWTLKEVVDLKVHVAELTVRIDTLTPTKHIASTYEHYTQNSVAGR